MMLSGPDSSMLRVLVLLLLPARSSCAVEEHRISSLPGYGAPSVPMYSGTVATPHPTVAGVTARLACAAASARVSARVEREPRRGATCARRAVGAPTKVDAIVRNG